MKSNSVYQKPCIFDDLGNGTMHYNFNIIEGQRTDEQTGEETPSFDYDQVTISGKPTYSKVVAAVIREKYTVDKELSLINNYNRYQSATAANKVAKHKEEYEAYLEDTAHIKEFVKVDCLAFNVAIDD